MAWENDTAKPSPTIAKVARTIPATTPIDNIKISGSTNPPVLGILRKNPTGFVMTFTTVFRIAVIFFSIEFSILISSVLVCGKKSSHASGNRLEAPMA